MEAMTFATEPAHDRSNSKTKVAKLSANKCYQTIFHDTSPKQTIKWLAVLVKIEQYADALSLANPFVSFYL